MQRGVDFLRRVWGEACSWMDALVPEDVMSTDFEGSTKGMGAPRGWDAARSGKCSVLRVQEVSHVVVQDPDDPNRMINYKDLPYPEYQSLWGLTPMQRIKLLFTGRIWIRAVGVQPPITVGVTRIYNAVDAVDAVYDPEEPQQELYGVVKAVLDKHRHKPIEELTVDDCREIITAFGDPLRVLPTLSNMDDGEYWQLQLQAALGEAGALK